MGVFRYPEARRDDTVVDDYNGIKVSDPYRWLEDPDSEETKAFVDAQNQISAPFLEKCPVSEKIKNRITDIWDYPKYGCPRKRGDYYYYSYNSGLQNQSVTYVQDSIDGEARVFLDPNKLSDDGTVSLSGSAFTEDGSVYAYGLSKSGSDWISIHFKKAPSGEDFPDVLERVKFSSMAWMHDNTGFFYNMYPEQEGKSDGTETTTNIHQKLYYHKLATKQSEDILVAEFPDNPKWMIGAEVSDCGRYIIIYIREGCEPVNRLYYVDIKTLPNGVEGKLPFEKIVDNFDAEYDYVTNEGSVFTFKTNLNSPRYKLININLSKPQMKNWVTLVDEDEKSVLEWVGCVNENKLVLCYLEDVKNKLYIHDLAGGERKGELPLDVGTIVGYSGRKTDTEIFYQFMSFLTPGIIYNCDMTTAAYKPSVFREIKVKDFDVSGFQTKQIFYPSQDGTKIPMFIVHKKGLMLDGSHAVLLYGYGGFSVSISPTFSPSRLVLLQHLNVIYAIANIRGGGEYGETWHKAGCCGNKQNGLTDFQCAAEYLIDNKYSSPQRIAIQGGSNGGLLVSACSNQRPDLFGASIAQVGVLDMLRFHKFTIGHAWTTDYGCSEKPEEFDWLYKYSPYHNIKIPDGDVEYPSMLLLTGDHDDRVVPLHSLKYIAEVQRLVGANDKQKNPLIIRIDTKSGHGAGKPTSKVIEEVSDIYSFLFLTLNLSWSE